MGDQPSGADVHSTRLLSVPKDLDANETSPPTSPSGPSATYDREAVSFGSRDVGLEVLNGPAQNKIFPLNGGQLFIAGRAPGLDITVPDQAVSRRHCQLTWVRDMLWIEDLASSNGTHLNGEPIERAALQDGDVVRLGETELLVTVLPEDHPALGGEVSESEQTVMLTRGEMGVEVERALGSVRSALRDVERALIHAFRSANEAEGLYRTWSRRAKDLERTAEEAAGERERLHEELERTKAQVAGIGKLLAGDSAALNDEVNRLQLQLSEKAETVEEAGSRIRALERELSSLQAELESQRTATALAQAALADERKHAASQAEQA